MVTKPLFQVGGQRLTIFCHLAGEASNNRSGPSENAKMLSVWSDFCHSNSAVFGLDYCIPVP